MYELYIDSLFCITFIMNLYLLILMNEQLNHPAKGLRVLLGAIFYAIGTCLIYLVPIPIASLKIGLIAIILGTSIPLFVFKIHSGSAFFRTIEIMAGDALLIGGVIFALVNLFPDLKSNSIPICIVLIIGGIIVLLVLNRVRRDKNLTNQPCRVIIHNGHGGQITVLALIDTGNSLMEPISGKPVSILEQEVFYKLWEDKDFVGYRAIPYKSVGCENGIMKGYEVPEIQIEQNGIRKTCKNIYIGICNNTVSKRKHYRMLIHPSLLQ